MLVNSMLSPLRVRLTFEVLRVTWKVSAVFDFVWGGEGVMSEAGILVRTYNRSRASFCELAICV